MPKESQTDLTERGNFEDYQDAYLNLAPAKNLSKTSSNASLQEAWKLTQRQFRQDSLRHHPDMNLGRADKDTLTKKFHEIMDAKDRAEKASRLLLNPVERLICDQCGDFRLKNWREAFLRETGNGPIEVAAKKKESREDKAARERIYAKKKETEELSFCEVFYHSLSFHHKMHAISL